MTGEQWNEILEECKKLAEEHQQKKDLISDMLSKIENAKEITYEHVDLKRSVEQEMQKLDEIEKEYNNLIEKAKIDKASK